MKVYYDKLSKEEKKIVKEKYKSSDDSRVYKKAAKIIIFCILGVLVSIIAGVFDYIYKTGTLNYVIDGFLLIFSVIVLIRMLIIRRKLINKFALSIRGVK